MKTTEIAWAAGFFDGEGHIYFHRGVTSSAVRIRLRQKDPELLIRFQETFGIGRLYHEKDGLHSFEADGWRAHEIMKKLWPYLGSLSRMQYAQACNP